EGLDDVAAAPDAAVEQYFELVADGIGHGRQAADGRRGGVEVVAAVVGNRDRRGADVHGVAPVIRPGDPLDHEWADPLLPQPGEVLPGSRGRAHPLAVGAEEAGDLRVTRG